MGEFVMSSKSFYGGHANMSKEVLGLWNPIVSEVRKTEKLLKGYLAIQIPDDTLGVGPAHITVEAE